MTSRLGVLYDVAAAQRGVTSLFGAAGRGYGVAAAERGVTSLFGAGEHIAQPGNVTHWQVYSRGATSDVTVGGVSHYTTSRRPSSSCCNVDVMISLLLAYKTLSRH